MNKNFVDVGAVRLQRLKLKLVLYKIELKLERYRSANKEKII